MKTSKKTPTRPARTKVNRDERPASTGAHGSRRLEWHPAPVPASPEKNGRHQPAKPAQEFHPEVVGELLYEALETELGGVEIYKAAIRCARNPDLKKEWKKYLKQTESHVETMQKVCAKFGLDVDALTAGREIVKHVGSALVQAMNMALESGDAGAAERVAAECVTMAETKDHANWSLIGQIVKHSSGENAETLKWAHEKCENEEDEHLYHSRGWARELWIGALGMPAVLPPPEEVRHVKNAVSAAKAAAHREEQIHVNGEDGAATA